MKRLALLLSVPAALAAQAGAVTGVVRAKASGEPLSYSIVGIDGTTRAVFTNEAGQFTLRDVQPGRYRISAKRLGYKPVEIAVELRAGVTDTLVFSLERLAMRLATVDVSARPVCAKPGAPPATDTVLAPIVAQIRLNAEQLSLLSRQYPHEYGIEIKKVRMKDDSVLSAEPMRITAYMSKTRPSYRPGSALRFEERRGYIFQIPELQDIADSRFIAEHCWHYSGVDTIEGRPHFKVDAVASVYLVGVDINGTFVIDAETFQIRRSISRLSRWPSGIRSIADFESTTEYKEILPSVPVIAHVRTVQLVDPKARVPHTAIIEEQHAFAFRFTGRKPGEPPPERP